jgi:hypothetical protein
MYKNKSLTIAVFELGTSVRNSQLALKGPHTCPSQIPTWCRSPDCYAAVGDFAKWLTGIKYLAARGAFSGGSFAEYMIAQTWGLVRIMVSSMKAGNESVLTRTFVIQFAPKYWGIMDEIGYLRDGIDQMRDER